ncbi:MAG: radical SAM protein [Lachnospiraceae bacterium]|nr:radical SAM protein [Lachnospiraceae bacterium]
MKNLIINNVSELLLLFASKEEVALYGCGDVGKLTFCLLDTCGLSWKIKRVYVTNKKENDCFFGREIVSSKCGINDEFVLVSTSEQYHAEIMEELKDKCEISFAFTSEALIAEMRMLEYHRQSGCEIRQVHEQLGNISCRINSFVKTIPLRQLQFSVDITEHCNLNCIGCNHFSPLAENEFLNIERFEKDIKRLSFLAQGDAYRIELMGGEPLLNPDAIKYAIIARENFPNASIAFLSNGLLVKKMPKNFFEDCVKYDISIDLTPYPIELDYVELIDYIKKQGLIRSRFQTGANYRVWRKSFFDLDPREPSSNSADNWLNCIQANNCMNLRNGKLSCVTIQKIKHFINAFPEETKNMYFTPRDFIDIYQIDNVEEIFDFFAKPFAFCKYCKTRETREIQWDVSKKNIDEWV